MIDCERVEKRMLQTNNVVIHFIRRFYAGKKKKLPDCDE